MKYVIDMKLPSLNDYIGVCRSNKYQASKYKAKLEQEIGLFLTKMPKWTNPIKIHFHWTEGNKKRDLDNIAFAKKFILDAMQKYGKLENDNSKYVAGFSDSFTYSKDGSFKVVIEIEELKGE